MANPKRESQGVPQSRTPQVVPSLSQIRALSVDDLAKVDIAALNLACSGNLPGAEAIDVSEILDWLDEAARRVDFETSRHLYRYLQSPATYKNLPGYFCCYLMLQVLQEDFGVRYNPARVRDPTFQDPKCLDPDFRDGCNSPSARSGALICLDLRREGS